MAAITGAVIGGLSLANSVYQGMENRSAAKDAAKASQNAADRAYAAQQQNYTNTQTNLSPYIDAGKGALGQLVQLNSGNYSGFDQSPDYLYALSQGIQGVDRSAAARGSLYSGGHSADVLRTAEGLASQNLGNYRSALTTLSQMGQGASTNLGSIGAGNANAVSNIGFTNAGNQATAGYNLAAGNSNMAGNIGSTLGQLWGQYGNSIMGGSNAGGANASSYGGGISPIPNSFTTPNYTGPGSTSITWPGMTGGWGN